MTDIASKMQHHSSVYATTHLLSCVNSLYDIGQRLCRFKFGLVPGAASNGSSSLPHTMDGEKRDLKIFGQKNKQKKNWKRFDK